MLDTAREWAVDKVARRPNGLLGQAVYRDPRAHREGWRAAVRALHLFPDDLLLDLGCGGGSLLRDALASGCQTVGVDHSADMLRVTVRKNAEAVREGRLRVRLTDVAHLPFADGFFSKAVCTHAFFFMPEPAATLSEVRRVLAPGGRLALYTAAPEAAGTPAAPSLFAEQMRFYADEELTALARTAGFDLAVVSRPDRIGQLLVAERN